MRFLDMKVPLTFSVHSGELRDFKKQNRDA